MKDIDKKIREMDDVLKKSNIELSKSKIETFEKQQIDLSKKMSKNYHTFFNKY